MSDLPRGVIAAKFESWCDECDCRIEQGQEIVKGDTGRWIHVECPEVVLDRPSRFEGTSLDQMGY